MSQLTIASAPSYNDLSDAVLLANQALTSDALTKISHNAKLGTVRPETIYMGFYKNGDTVPAPISPVDGYVYTVATEVIWRLMIYSTRGAGIGFQSGQSDAPPIAASQAGAQYWWIVDINSSGVVSCSIGYINNSGAEVITNDGMVKIHAICQRVGPTTQTWTNLTTSGANVTTIVDASSGGHFQPWHVGFDLNIVGGANFVDGSYLIQSYVNSNSVVLASSPTPSGAGSSGAAALGIPAFLYIPDGVFAVSQPVKQGFASSKYGIVDLSHNAKAGNVRCEAIPMGYYANGATVPLPFSPIDGYLYNRGEVQYLYHFYSSLQPTGGFTNGQTTAPTIGSGLAKRTDIGPLYWDRNDIDFTTGIVTTNVSYFVHGGAETIETDGIVKVIAIGQRRSVNAAIVGVGGGSAAVSGLSTVTPGNSSNNAVPDAPVVGVIRGLQSQGSATYIMIIGVEPPEDDLGNITAQNWNDLIATELQIASDPGFSQLNTGGLTGASPDAGGSGYALNDVLTVVEGGASGGTVTVTGVNGGIVTSVSVTTPGAGYTTTTGLATTGGSGTGCTLNVFAIFDNAALPPANPPINYTFSTNFPGTYYIRARVENGFGWGDWSNTLTFNTNVFDNSTADTGLMDAPVPALLSNVAGSNPQIPGNAIEISFSVPPANSGTFFGYQIFIHQSPTLPTATTSATGTQGQLTSGSVIFTDPSASWTAGQWAGGYDLLVFSSARGATPTFDYEGWIVFAHISANTTNTITFEASPQTVHLTETNLKYYIVQSGVGAHFYEKLKWYSPVETDSSITGGNPVNQNSSRNINFPSALTGNLYCWVTCFNIFGSGKVVGSAPSAQFDGITTAEIASLAVTSAKIASGAVISSKLTASAQSFVSSITFSAANFQQVNWSSGTVKTADGTSYAVSSGNTGAMSVLTYIYLDPSVSSTVLQVSTSLSPSDTAILLCVAKPTADTTQDAFFVPAVGVLGINSTVIGPNSIATGSIQAAAITTGLLAAGAVTAAKISVVSLDAIAVNAGTITAGTFIGATFKTASAGARVQMDATNGLFGNNGGGNTWQLDTSGNSYFQTIQAIASSVMTIYGGSSGGLTLANFNGGGAIVALQGSGLISLEAGTGESIVFEVGGTGGMTITATAVTAAAGVSFRCASGQGVGTSTDAWAFTTNTEIQGFVSSTERIRIDTTSSTTKTPLWLYYNGTLTQVSVFNDGLGHNILYF